MVGSLLCPCPVVALSGRVGDEFAQDRQAGKDGVAGVRVRQAKSPQWWRCGTPAAYTMSGPENAENERCKERRCKKEDAA